MDEFLSLCCVVVEFFNTQRKERRKHERNEEDDEIETGRGMRAGKGENEWELCSLDIITMFISK